MHTIMRILVTFVSVVACCCAATSKPNIIIIVADDLAQGQEEEEEGRRGSLLAVLGRTILFQLFGFSMGWNDVGFHGSNQIPTPNIDALAFSGVILNNYYVMPLCTPSRAALMTGRHPIHTGMQHRVIYGGEPWGLGLVEELLPELLAAQGYVTRALGKWHLGHFHQQYTPTFRGFHSHFGYWTGHQDYYDHTAQESSHYWGYDMRRDLNVSRDSLGRYTTTLLTEEAVAVVRAHDTARPLLLYLAHLAVHSANPYLPLQAPQEAVRRFAHIHDKQRRTFAAMVALLDESVGAVTAALGSRGMLHNSLIVFTSDNGGPAGGFNQNAASNWPLRGTKDSMWEGGVRGAAFVWSPLLGNAPRVSTQLAHIQDWLPTLMAATNVSLVEHAESKLDGRNIWSALNDANIGTYDEILLAIDNQRNLSALRIGKWKLIQGTSYDGAYDRVISPSGREGAYDVSAVQRSLAARALAGTASPLPPRDIILALRRQATLSPCPQEDAGQLCQPLLGDTCLFDVEADPSECHNLASSHAAVLHSMLAALARHNATVVAPRNQPLDPASNPKYWGYTWNNWRDFPLPPAATST